MMNEPAVCDSVHKVTGENVVGLLGEDSASEQDHQIALATAPGVETPNVAKRPGPSNGAAKKETYPLTTAHS